jgi:hypothetical protein
MNAFVPASPHIGFVSIKTAPMAVMIVGFDIGSVCEPALNRSPAEAHALGNILDFCPLLSEGYYLLIAVITFCLMR